MTGLSGLGGPFCSAPVQEEDIIRLMPSTVSATNTLSVHFQVDVAFVNDSYFSLQYEGNTVLQKKIKYMYIIDVNVAW